MRYWLGDFEQAYTDSLCCVRHTVAEDHGGPPRILHHSCFYFHLRSKGASVANISMNYVFMLIRSICSSLSIVVKVILEQVPHVWGPCRTDFHSIMITCSATSFAPLHPLHLDPAPRSAPFSPTSSTTTKLCLLGRRRDKKHDGLSQSEHCDKPNPRPRPCALGKLDVRMSVRVSYKHYSWGRPR